jgi:quercetin dioxygenase-like cupin family protein
MKQLSLPLPHGYPVKIPQPFGIEVTTVDGIFIKQMVIPNAGTFVPQHAHVWNHTSLIAHGSIFCWKDGALDRRYEAPSAILILAGIKHLFQSLEDNTIIYCIHNLHDKDKISILEEHNLSDYALEEVT